MIELTDKKTKINRELKGKSLIEFPTDFIVFDIETTGLDPLYNEIIEIAALKIKDLKIVDTFSTLIKPTNEIDEFITSLTHITNEMVTDAPSISEVLPEFMNFIQDNILVGHNVNFDIDFIYDNLNECGLDALTNDFVDTLRISRKVFPNMYHHRLSDLAAIYNIDVNGNHRSLKDCEITFEVYKHLKEEVENSCNDLEAFQRKFKKYYNNIRAKDIKAQKSEFDKDNPFYSKYVAITGTLNRFTRKEAMQVIADSGGFIEDTVTTKTNFLILGNSSSNPYLKGKKSSKLKKAEQFKLNGNDIEIIDEFTFYEIINNYIQEEIESK